MCSKTALAVRLDYFEYINFGDKHFVHHSEVAPFSEVLF